MAARFVDVSESQIEQFKEILFYFSNNHHAILLKQLVTSGSVNVAIVTSTSFRWLFADIYVAFGD